MINDGVWGVPHFQTNMILKLSAIKKSAVDKDRISQILYVGLIHRCIDPLILSLIHPPVRTASKRLPYVYLVYGYPIQSNHV